MNKETPRFARITRMSERLADLCRRLWKDNDPAAVSLQSILEEYREDTINVARIIPEYEKAVKDKAEAIKHEFEISYGGKMEVLEAQLRELKAKSAEAEEKCVLKDSKILELSGIIEKREKELEELNAKVFGAESDYNARFNSKVQQLYEETGKKEAERAHFWENRHKMIEEKSGDLEKKYLSKLSGLDDKAKALENDFKSRKEELFAAADRIRGDLEAREKNLNQLSDELQERENSLSQIESRTKKGIKVTEE